MTSDCHAVKRRAKLRTGKGLSEMDDICKRCYHRTDLYGGNVCAAGTVLRRLDAMRHPDSPCGPGAKLFVDREGDEE